MQVSDVMKDLTFIIPVRVDSEIRLRNLLLVVGFLLDHMQDSSLYIMEGDSSPKVKGLPSTDRIKYCFIEDHDPVFFRTKYLNRMTAMVRTAYLAVWDTDVLVAESQIREAYMRLRSGESDFVFPYDGRLYQVTLFFQDAYKQNGDLSILTEYTPILPLMFGNNSYGGCFMVNCEKYIRAGMENEHFYGWGPEDLERVKRWEILGYKLSRIQGPAFHWDHPVLENSRSFNREIGQKNNRELFRICSMSKKELSEEVVGWKKKILV